MDDFCGGQESFIPATETTGPDPELKKSLTFLGILLEVSNNVLTRNLATRQEGLW